MREATEMELRVARAIGESLGHTHFATKRYLSEARAAIRAMRDPTVQMLAATLPITGGANDDTPEADTILAAEACHAWQTPESAMAMGIDGALGVIADWRSMIDAASPPTAPEGTER